MRLINLYVPEAKLAAIDILVAKRFYPNRAEAIREAINDLLKVHDAIPQVVNVVKKAPLTKNIQRPPEYLLPTAR